MAKGQGYPLPPGEAYEDELECALVFYPAREEYRRALLGSLTYFATWKAWEKDAEHRGIDAADSWKLALECTLECWNMACLEEMINDIADIKEILLGFDPCCSENITYETTIIITTTISPGVGDDPTHYGETEVADWEEWLEHLCYQAHKYVDTLKHYGQTVDTLLTAGSLTLAGWASVLDYLQFLGLPVPFYIGDLMEWLGDFFTGAVSTWFDDVVEDLEDARDDIVCAIMLDGDLESTIENALSSSLAWSLFYGLINYDGVKSLLYEGGYEEEYLETETRDDCDCAEPSGVFVNAVGGANPPFYSKDEGDNWYSMINHEIEFGFEYWICCGIGGDNVGWAAVDSEDDPVDVVVTDMDVNYPAPNGLYWNAVKADTTVIETNVLRVKDGDYPFSYAQVHWWTAAQNTLGYTSGYHLSCTFTEYAP